jgi:heptosyltransferase-2
VQWDFSKHDALRQLSLVKALGLDVDNLDKNLKSMRIKIAPNSRFLDLKGAVAMAPGSQWATKRWGVDGFAKAAQHFIKAGKKVVIVGSPDEKPLAEEIKSLCPGVLDYVGQTDIYSLAQLLSECSLLLSNDNGAMHVATAAGIPVVTVFGPTVPAQGYSPWSEQSRVVQTKLGCRPCGPHGHTQCPIGTHDCMKKVYAESVIFACEETLHEARV